MENSINPLVSVVIPAYNAEAFIAKTLKTVIGQTYRNIEIVLVDDGSSDRTRQIVQAMVEQDPRIKLLQQSNAGVAAARNLGIQSARGNLLRQLMRTIYWYPEAIAKLVTQFQSHGDKLGVAYAWSIDIDERDQPTGGFHAAVIHGNVYKTLLCHNFLGNSSSTLIRKSCLKQVGGYNAQFRTQRAQGCEDWDLYLRLAEHYEFRGVPEFLVGYRKIARSMSGDCSQMARSQQLMLQTVRQKHPELPRFLYRLSCSSFYIHLAFQSDTQGQVSETLHWLKQAITIDITPVVRLGFYRLLIKNLILLSRQHWFSLNLDKDELIETSAEKSKEDSPPDFPFDSPSQYFISPFYQFQVQLKILTGALLHQTLFVVL